MSVFFDNQLFMTFWLSEPIEQLLSNNDWKLNSDRNSNPPIIEVDHLIVGSGYGAAMSALAIAQALNEKGTKESIWVFERGNEYLPTDFPKVMGELPEFLGVTNDEENSSIPDGFNIGVTDNSLWDVRIGNGVTSIIGSGLGGTSLINAGIAI